MQFLTELCGHLQDSAGSQARWLAMHGQDDQAGQAHAVSNGKFAKVVVLRDEYAISLERSPGHINIIGAVQRVGDPIDIMPR